MKSTEESDKLPSFDWKAHIIQVVIVAILTGFVVGWIVSGYAD